jgi:hypothetical protein
VAAACLQRSDRNGQITTVTTQQLNYNSQPAQQYAQQYAQRYVRKEDASNRAPVRLSVLHEPSVHARPSEVTRSGKGLRGCLFFSSCTLFLLLFSFVVLSAALLNTQIDRLAAP